MNLTPLQKRQKPKMERNTDNLSEQTFPLQTVEEQKALPGDLQRLDEKLKSMMEVSQSIIGKSGVWKRRTKHGFRDHIEGHH